jgi:hypothetical protein
MTQRAPIAVRRIAIGLVVLLLAGALAAPAVATTADGVRAYRATVEEPSSGGCVVPSEPGRFTLTITNTSQTIQLGSADVTLGAPWLSGPTAVEVDGRPSTPRGSTIELRNLGLSPQQSVHVTFTATPAAGDNPIATRAKQANNFSGPPGNDLVLFGAVPTVTADPTCAAVTLTFETQPADAEVGQRIPGAGPGVWPRVKAERGNEPVANVHVRIELDEGNFSGDFTSDSKTTATTGADGIATFDELMVAPSGEGYVLVASAEEAAEHATSHPFDVDDAVATCSSGTTCTTQIEAQTGVTATASGTASDGEGRLALSSFVFTECTVPDGVTLSRIPGAITVNGSSLVGKQITFTIDEETRKRETDNGVASYQVCVEPVGDISKGETLSFRDRYSGELVTGATTTNDPRGAVRGWLPDCVSSGNPKNRVGPPCVSDRRGTGDGGVAITVNFGTRFRMG